VDAIDADVQLADPRILRDQHHRRKINAARDALKADRGQTVNGNHRAGEPEGEPLSHRARDSQSRKCARPRAKGDRVALREFTTPATRDLFDHLEHVFRMAAKARTALKGLRCDDSVGIQQRYAAEFGRRIKCEDERQGGIEAAGTPDFSVEARLTSEPAFWF
jgi:hypothetical protein